MLPVEAQKDSLGKFVRTSAAGFFTVTNHPSPGIIPNVVPPARVTDLRFIRASEEDLTVELQWTAVGSDLYEGTGRISTHILRRSRNSLAKTEIIFTNYHAF